MSTPLPSASTDPTLLFELFRGSYATELLTAAVAHFGVFGRLAESPQWFDELRMALGLQQRPATVLITALRAMGLIDVVEGRLTLAPLAAEHLVPGGAFDVGDYLGLAAQSPGVLAMVERLKTNKPANFDNASGAAFIYRDGIASAMEQAESARHFTLALAGRAKNVAPHLAERVDLSQAKCVLDVGGGTGIYSIALLKRNRRLTAIVLDRPEVLRVAEEMAQQYDVSDRLELLPGDMFADPLPRDCDVVLLSNILHDWGVLQCRQLIDRCAAALPSGGRLLIHDVFLNDELDGPLPIALYSAALFTLTEGRAYSAAEYRGWMEEAGLKVGHIVPTLIHCGALTGERGT
jgi:SAM-dependent methyltransferase